LRDTIYSSKQLAIEKEIIVNINQSTPQLNSIHVNISAYFV